MKDGPVEEPSPVTRLTDESDEDPDLGHGGDWIELYPDGLGFHAPWNGAYDT